MNGRHCRGRLSIIAPQNSFAPSRLCVRSLCSWRSFAASIAGRKALSSRRNRGAKRWWFCVFALAIQARRFSTRWANSLFAGISDRFPGDTLGKVFAQPPLSGLSRWSTRLFPACKSPESVTPLRFAGFPSFPFPLFPSYTDVCFVIVPGPKGRCLGKPARDNLCQRAAFFTRREQPDGRNWPLPCTFQGLPKETDFRRPTKVCHKRSIPAGRGPTDRRILAFDGHTQARGGLFCRGNR
jgi:hypothetical protein